MQTNIMQRNIYFYLDSHDGVQNGETRGDLQKRWRSSGTSFRYHLTTFAPVPENKEINSYIMTLFSYELFML